MVRGDVLSLGVVVPPDFVCRGGTNYRRKCDSTRDSSKTVLRAYSV